MIRDKIIIVEDDPGISKYLQAALRSHEYDTLLAPDGKTALEMIASHCAGGGGAGGARATAGPRGR